jgi:23S rRNA pseudouridine2604 synthase
MADAPRKTLILPPKAAVEELSAPGGRRSIRGAAPERSLGPETRWEKRSPGESARRAPQQKSRGTPSRAPVAAKAEALVHQPLVLVRAPSSGVRISKLMAERGLSSRREADAYIERGWVWVDGERVTELGTRADPSVTITLDREARNCQQQQMTLLLHKPVGYVSGQPEPGFVPAVTLIQPETQALTPGTPVFQPRHLKGLAPAGRLDIDSTGLLVLTQDGRVARQLIGENSTVDKEYLVRVEGRLDAKGLALLNYGLSLDNRQLRPAQVEWLNDDQLRFVLREGRKRQIRRMCELVGIKAVGLKRVRIGRVKLGDLPLGQWRFLREDESF